MSDQSGLLTWDGYKSWVSSVVKEKKVFFCRGQSNNVWKLQTSFHRVSEKYNINMTDYFDRMLPEVHYYISAVKNEIIDFSKENEFASFLSLIQHHGFPTPLLDWTRSPYIAAYFAFRNVYDDFPTSDYVKIFLFDVLEWMKTFKQPNNIRDNSISFVSVLRPHAKYNPRIIPQQGAFTLTNVKDMETYINERGLDSGKNYLYFALLSVKEKPNVLRELDLMGINEMTLFPSVSGICDYLKNSFFAKDKIGKTITDLLAEIDNKKDTK
jgi:hypothetical protein